MRPSSFALLAVAMFATAHANAESYVESNLFGMTFPSLAAASAHCDANGLCETTGAWEYDGYIAGAHRYSQDINWIFSPNSLDVRLSGSCNDPLGTPENFCEAPPSCNYGDVSTPTFNATGSGTAPASVCDPVTNCTATLNSSTGIGGSFTASYTIQDQACGTEPEQTPSDENCISTGTLTVCTDGSADENCGMYNGEYVCLPDVPEGNCLFTPGGQAICDGGALTQTPDGTVTDENGDTYDVYGSGLDGTDGTQTGSDGGNAEAVGNEEENADPVPGGVPDLEVAGEWDAIMSGFYNRVTAAPLVAAVTAIPTALPTGACNGVTSDPLAALGNQTLTIDAHCTLWPDLLVVIQGVMLAIWVLLGALIILRA